MGAGARSVLRHSKATGAPGVGAGTPHRVEHRRSRGSAGSSFAQGTRGADFFAAAFHGAPSTATLAATD